MSIKIAHYPDEERLDLTLAETIDLSLSQQVIEAAQYVNEHLRVCIIDCSRVAYVFESGLALMASLIEKMKTSGVEVILIGDAPGLNLDGLVESR